MKTLLIIDVQTAYEDDVDESKKLPHIIKLTQFAKDNKWNIIVLNYTGAGPVVRRLENEIKGYSKLVRLYKPDCDGGRIVINFMKHHKMCKNDIVVCGLYAEDCVWKTTSTMTKLVENINLSIVKRATISISFKSFPKYFNPIKVI